MLQNRLDGFHPAPKTHLKIITATATNWHLRWHFQQKNWKHCWRTKEWNLYCSLQIVMWDRPATHSQKQRTVNVCVYCLRARSSLLSPTYGHLSVLIQLSSLNYSSSVRLCDVLWSIKVSFPFSFKWIKNWGEHAKWLTSTYRKVTLTPQSPDKASFLRLVSGMVDQGWAEVFNFQACWCDTFYGFDILHVLFFKKELDKI